MLKTMFRFPLNLQLFAEGDPVDPGVDSALAAEEQQQDVPPPGDDAQADPTQNNFEKAFAKRLSAKEAEWQKKFDDLQAQYKDHDAYKKAAEYLQRTSGIADVLTLKEEIELVELQERAEKEQVPPSVLKRIDELEAKAAKADEMEAKDAQQKEWNDFETSLKDFVQGKEIGGKALDHMELWKYMHENGVSKPEVAYKAMRADFAEAALETAKTDAVNDYLKSKQGPKIEGSQGSAAIPATSPPKDWREAEQRTLARMQAAREAQ